MVLSTALMAIAAPHLSLAASGERLRIVTTHVPPLVIEQGGELPGALHELVTEICTRLGHLAQIEFFPWKRAIFLTGQRPKSAIFPLTRLAKREKHFRWLAQLYEEQYAFLAPSGRRFDVRHHERMKNQRIALLRGSSLTEVLRELGFLNIVEADSVDEVHRFMSAGMADAAFGEMAIIRSSLLSRAAEQQFDVGEPVRRTTAWLAGSLDFTAADAARFQAAMKTMVDDGTHLAILRKYKLS